MQSGNERPQLSLVDVATGRGVDGERPLGHAAALHAFHSGLQDLLSILCAIPIAPALQSAKIPPSLTTRFASAFTNPTLGGLLQLLVWSCREPGLQAPPSLVRHLADSEKGGQGFLGELVQLRNRWAHPQAESPEQVLARAVERLERAPGLFLEKRIALDALHRAAWIEEERAYPMAPMVGFDGQRLSIPHGLSPDQGLVLSTPDPERQESFLELWREARIRDGALADPTAAEVRKKALRIAEPWTGASPWWFEEIGSAGAPALLVTPEAIPGVLAAVVRDRPEMTPIQLTVEDGAALPQAMASRLGLGSPPDVAALCGLSPASSPLVLAVETKGLTSRGFLDLLFWLSDLVAADPKPTLRLLLARSEAELAKDQDRLWDRLPEDLSLLLRRPPRSEGGSLPSFLWPDRRPKRFGLF